MASNVVNATQVRTETEYKRLLELIRKPPRSERLGGLYCEVIKFTPELAELILKNLGSNNRPLRSRAVAKYAEFMVNDDWTLTGETIAFSDRERLRNGQHRLAACIRAGVPFETLVVFGIDDKAFDVIDSGTKRTGGDVFATAGVPYYAITGKAMRWLRIMAADPTSRTSFTAHELFSDYRAMSKADQAAIARWAGEAYAVCRGTKLSAESLTALLYLMAKKNGRLTERFVGDLRKRKGNAKVLLVKMEKIGKQVLGRIEETQRNALTILCWNAYQRNDRVTQRDLSWTDGKTFPVI